MECLGRAWLGRTSELRPECTGGGRVEMWGGNKLVPILIETREVIKAIIPYPRIIEH